MGIEPKAGAKRRSGALHQLSTRQVQAAGIGPHRDGGGLFLKVTETGASWVFRFTSPAGKRREMGLGACHRGSAAQAGASLTAARDLAHRARELLRNGVDPIDAREGSKEAAQAAVEPPALLSALLDVTPHERARNLRGDKVPDTVMRIRPRLDAVFEDAIFHKRASVNPAAAIRRKMREAAPRRTKGKLRALPYREAPAFMSALRSAEGVAARCLEFAVLTAARTSEALLAEWTEFDLDASTWTVPARRMKAKEEHVVYLSPRALEVLQAMQGADARYVFPSTSPKADGSARPMSDMAMLTTLGRLGYRDRTTVHGLARATFSTWANETSAGRPDVVEACLAHEEGNRVRASYNRARFNDERRELLKAWAEFLARPAAPDVQLETKRA